ncbi:hypothetical protein pipiens_019296 [Culex pipiens pipiens]|uniref:SET domain-containing protein n=1 Tax=Culex pipiens pipiens TaxID=38569 RepID=A0ABD1DV18_CULPP
MVIMGPQGLTAAQVSAIWEERPLSLLNLDFVLGGPRSDDDYDAFDAFFSDHLLAERAPSLAKGNKAADRIRAEGNRFYSGGNALDLDYTEYDPLEEWKDLCNVKVVEPGIVFAYRNENFARLAGSAHCYMLLKNPAVAAIVNTPAKRTFMYQRVRDFVRLANFYKWESFSSPLCPVASLFNHSCDANAVATIHSDKIRIVVLRPIRAGEQICVSYGPSWWDKPDPTPYRAHFECKCVACDPEKYDEWRAQGREPPASFFKNAETAIAVLGDELANNAAKYNAITQLIEKYAYLHPQKNFAALLYKHQESLRTLIDDEDGTYHRTIAHAKLEEEDE